MNDLERRDGLTQALRRLAEADRTMTTSPAVEARLRAEVRAMGGRSKTWNGGTLLALAAAVTICVSVPALWWRTHGQPGSTDAPHATTVAREATTEFFPLFYGSVPSSSGHIVRMEVPRASLAQFGLASAHDVDRTTGTVIADVLVGDDGLARAVRFVRPIFQE
jgi:RecA/RadA recombinase